MSNSHWLVLPVDPEGESFIAWGSVEADEYRSQPAVYRVEKYVRADIHEGAVKALREIQEIAAREWAADETNYEWYGDIAGIAETTLGSQP